MKKIILLLMITVLTLSLCGCMGKTNTKEEVTTLSPEKTVAIYAGDYKVYLDEAKYYVYTAQATYETYYISEGKDINWKSIMSGKTTWTDGVKSTVLDDICRRESMYARAKEFNITLTDEEKTSIKQDVENYYNKSSKKLISKIGIGEENLEKVFEKKAIAQKVEDIMTVTDKKMPDTEYEKWKDGNTVTANNQWQKINFNTHIFVLEDTQWESK